LLFLYLKVAINRKHTLTATDRCVYYQVCWKYLKKSCSIGYKHSN
jgi:hypothetical protein